MGSRRAVVCTEAIAGTLVALVVIIVDVIVVMVLNVDADLSSWGLFAVPFSMGVVPMAREVGSEFTSIQTAGQLSVLCPMVREWRKPDRQPKASVVLVVGWHDGDLLVLRVRLWW